MNSFIRAVGTPRALQGAGPVYRYAPALTNIDVSEGAAQISDGLVFPWDEHASALLSKRAIRNSQITLIKLVNNRYKKRHPFA